MPEDWQKAIWKKKGSKKDCSTNRGISLLSHEGKMYAKILEQRTRVKTEHLSDAQFGFRKGRGCTDKIFALLTTVRKGDQIWPGSPSCVR